MKTHQWILETIVAAECGSKRDQPAYIHGIEPAADMWLPMDKLPKFEDRSNGQKILLKAKCGIDRRGYSIELGRWNRSVNKWDIDGIFFDDEDSIAFSVINEA